jgi:hypothetical protein
MTSILIKKNRGAESIFSCQRGLRGEMFENHWVRVFGNVANLPL